MNREFERDGRTRRSLSLDRQEIADGRHYKAERKTNSARNRRAGVSHLVITIDTQLRQ